MPESRNLYTFNFHSLETLWSLVFSRRRASKMAPMSLGSVRLHAKSQKPEAVFSVPVTFRRHEAADGRADANDARTPAHDASPSTHDDASQAGHDATGQIRARRSLPIFVAVNRAAHGRTSADFLCNLAPQKMTPLLGLPSFFKCYQNGIYLIYTHYYFFLTIFGAFFCFVFCLNEKYFHSFTMTDFYKYKHLKTLFWYDSRVFVLWTLFYLFSLVVHRIALNKKGFQTSLFFLIPSYQSGLFFRTC